jgi:hypothetical protein
MVFSMLNPPAFREAQFAAHVERHHRADAAPAAARDHVAVAERHVILKREIESAGLRHRDSAVLQECGPHGNLGEMRHHQHEYGDQEQRREPHENVQIVRPARDVARDHHNQAGHHRMDGEIDDADAAADERLIKHAVGSYLAWIVQLSASSRRNQTTWNLRHHVTDLILRRRQSRRLEGPVAGRSHLSR